MARKIKIKKKESLKKPDEFLTFSQKFLKYTKEHEKPVLIASVLIIIAILALSLFTYYYRSKNALGYQYLANALEKEGDQKAKKELLIKVKNIPLSSASKYASFYLAQIYLSENNVTEAKNELKKAFSINDTYIKGAAYTIMTDILLKENKVTDALNNIEKAIPAIESPFKEELLYKKASILEQQNKVTEAKKVYQELLKLNPDFYLSKLVLAKSED